MAIGALRDIGATPGPLWRIAGRVGFGRWLASAVLLGLVVVRVWDPFPVEVVRLKIFDLYQQAHPRQAEVHPVVVVDLDEESLDEVGQWPWPRTLVARMIEQLIAMGAVGIGFDVVFAEPDRMSPGHYAESIKSLSPDLRQELRALPNNDAVLARVLAQATVVLGESGYHRAVEGSDVSPREIPVMFLGPDPSAQVPRFSHRVRNIPELEAAAQGVGFFNLVPERDGIVRRVPLVIFIGGQLVPALPIELLRVLAGPKSPLLIKSDEAGIRGIGAAGMEVPTDPIGRMWVNFSRDDPKLYVSAADVLEGRVAAERIKGRIVLVGTSAAGLFDIKSTPLDRQRPGVAIHAQILETILTQTFLIRPHYALGAEVALQVLVGVLIIIIVPVFGALTTLITGALLTAALAALSWFLYLRAGVLLDVSYPSASALVTFSILVFANYFREEAQKRQVRTAFGQYLSPELVNQLVQDTTQLKLGGESKDMTVLFCDIRGFTTISEGYADDPVGLTSLTNRLLTPLSDAIMERRGTIDKYMGDAVMAFWNAPLDDANHAVNACRAALDMRRSLAALNDSLAQEAQAAGQSDALAIRVGIGINSGRCVVGNLGTAKHFDYSVLGDSVNIASRLEGQSSTYGVDIVVGPTTVALSKGEFTFFELDQIRVKGKREPVTIFALVGGREVGAESGFRQLAALAAEALAAYRARDWSGARSALAEMAPAALRYGLSGFVDLYHRRVDSFEANPPDDDWSGVFVAETK